MISNWDKFIARIPMKLISNTLASTLNRRQILKALLATSAVAGFSGSPVLANAPKITSIKDEDRAFLLKISKDIYPHDGFLDDQPYIDVVDAVIKEANTNQATNTLITDGLSDLEKQTQATHGKSYVELESYGAREAMLRRIELSDFFQKVRGGLLFGLYNNKSLFPKFGYEGSSWEEGGYIDRGFSDMTWLPQDPRLQGDKK